MRLKNGTIYRFVNDYHDGYGLNIYGTGAGSIKGGQNVCLYPASSDDKMQQWKAVDAEEEADTFRLCAVVMAALQPLTRTTPTCVKKTVQVMRTAPWR